MIAITGIGIVSAHGVGKDLFIKGITRGQALERMSLSALGRDFLVGRVKGFVPKKYIPAMKVRRMSRFSQLGLVSAIEAWQDSEIGDRYNPESVGVIVGTGLGSVSSTDAFYLGLLQRGPEETNPMLFPETVQNIAAAHISIHLKLKGPNTTFSEAACSGEHALYYGAELLRQGNADAVVVTGVDELTEPFIEGLTTLRVLSKSERLCPFDISRDGIVPGEGAATVVLERLDDATKRGAKIYGLINSFSMRSDAVERLNYSCSEAMAETMKEATKAAAPDLIIASANSTVQLDRLEASAIREVFGERVPVTSITSSVGFWMGGGVLRIAGGALFIKYGIIPPIWGLTTAELEGINYNLHTKEEKIGKVLVNGFSHGGTNICIVLRSYEA